MNLDLSPEQAMIRDVARDFAEKEVRPIAEAIDREARFPKETVRRMGELGLMGIFIPEECGGSGGDAVAYSLAVEEL
ncbi:MAG TPA: acyl-CoA dehydrogenase family protein, partial [Methylomirabilota bacterium]